MKREKKDVCKVYHKRPINLYIGQYIIATTDSSTLAGGLAVPFRRALKVSDDSADGILALKLTIPAGVGGDAEDAGDVEFECDVEGVSGVVEGYRRAQHWYLEGRVEGALVEMDDVRRMKGSGLKSSCTYAAPPVSLLPPVSNNCAGAG